MVDDSVVSDVFKYLSKASDSCLRYNHPLSIMHENMEPEQIGTFVILSVNGSLYLLTAAHVAVNCIKNGFYYCEGDGFTKFSGLLLRTEGTDLDRIDIAVLMLDDDSQLNNLKIISDDMILEGDVAPEGVYSVMGFPANKTRIDRPKRIIKSTHYVYYGPRCDEGKYHDIGLSMESHIAIDFNQKKCLSHKNTKVTFPSPNGMSGGSMWYYDIEAGKTFFAGIATTNNKRNHCIYGIRASLLKLATQHLLSSPL